MRRIVLSMLSSGSLSAFSSSATSQFAEARAALAGASVPFEPREPRGTARASRRGLALRRAEAGEILPRGSLLDLLV